MKTPIPSLKQFGAWATGLTDSYRFNPFVQATVHIIVLLAILGALLVAISGWSIQYAQNGTVGSITMHIQEVLHGSSTSTQSLPEDIMDVRKQTLLYVFFGLIAIIVLFGALLIRFALSPAKEALQMQKRFIGNVAHELRTPLAVIKTTTEVSLMDPSLSQDMRDTLNTTITELDWISETINNLLSFDTLLQPGRMRFEPVDLGSIVKNVVEQHAALALSRGIKIAIHESGRRMVMGNPRALDQLITNLIKNALNYTPADKDGTVTISIETDYRNRTVLAVRDTGIGIAQKDLYHVFEPFYRGDTSRARGIGTGTSGLGLAIVNEIVRLHHGAIRIRSELGNGTTIEVSFPSGTQDEVLPNPLIVPAPNEDPQDGSYEVSADFS